MKCASFRINDHHYQKNLSDQLAFKYHFGASLSLIEVNGTGVEIYK